MAGPRVFKIAKAARQLSSTTFGTLQRPFLWRRASGLASFYGKKDSSRGIACVECCLLGVGLRQFLSLTDHVQSRRPITTTGFGNSGPTGTSPERQPTGHFGPRPIYNLRLKARQGSMPHSPHRQPYSHETAPHVRHDVHTGPSVTSRPLPPGPSLRPSGSAPSHQKTLTSSRLITPPLTPPARARPPSEADRPRTGRSRTSRHRPAT